MIETSSATRSRDCIVEGSGMLRRNRPEPTSATSARAISEITSRPRRRLCVQPSAPPRPPVFKISLMSAAGSLDGGDDAEDQTGEQGDQQRKSEHAGIEGKINRAVERNGGRKRPQHVASPIGDEKAGQAAEQRKHGASQSEAGGRGGGVQRPLAARMLNSFSRLAACASKRLARLTHAIKRTKPTTPISTPPARENCLR